jgi:hypothetical protein
MTTEKMIEKKSGVPFHQNHPVLDTLDFGDVRDLMEEYAQQSGNVGQLQTLMNDTSEWSDKTFGENQRNPAIIYHLKKEVDELLSEFKSIKDIPFDAPDEFFKEAVNKIKGEYADCFILILDSAHHFGFTVENLIECTRAKLEINKLRNWGKLDENGVVKHIKQQIKGK